MCNTININSNISIKRLNALNKFLNRKHHVKYNDNYKHEFLNIMAKRLINQFSRNKNSSTAYIRACQGINLSKLFLSYVSQYATGTAKDFINGCIRDYEAITRVLVYSFTVNVTIVDDSGKFGSDYIPPSCS